MSLALELEAKAKFPNHTANGRDCRAWAKRIIYREDCGDRDVTVLQLAMAQNAMQSKVDQFNDAVG